MLIPVVNGSVIVRFSLYAYLSARKPDGARQDIRAGNAHSFHRLKQTSFCFRLAFSYIIHLSYLPLRRHRAQYRRIMTAGGLCHEKNEESHLHDEVAFPILTRTRGPEDILVLIIANLQETEMRLLLITSAHRCKS
ncbi:hypothetical protein HA50_25845 [Pantoea cypripedii]|uniref:Uncharacterized protein n=1 Tax=Pantoea cypripedii TaxID=55209 RepID=A0A1X1EM51_PANCY|nr:hypothetical protein HA50_25845 [Pantoea cypripedii]